MLHKCFVFAGLVSSHTDIHNAINKGIRRTGNRLVDRANTIQYPHISTFNSRSAVINVIFQWTSFNNISAETDPRTLKGLTQAKIIKKNFCSSSLWSCLHHMVLLGSQNKITDFLMILVWASPFKMETYL